MVEPPHVLAVIPARGGSKGVRLKNLRIVGGQSLLARTIGVTLEIPEISHVCVSTDHDAIKRAAEKFIGVEVIDRPSELSGDRVADGPVLQHAIQEMESRIESKFDVVLLLQVTSPLRTIEDIRLCLQEIRNPDFDAVWTVSPTEPHYHPLKQLLVQEDGRFEFFDPAGSKVVARQELRPVFHRNGACYALRRDFVMESVNLFSPNKSKAVVSRGARVNIDTEDDIRLADEILSKKSLPHSVTGYEAVTDG